MFSVKNFQRFLGSSKRLSEARFFCDIFDFSLINSCAMFSSECFVAQLMCRSTVYPFSYKYLAPQAESFKAAGPLNPKWVISKIPLCFKLESSICSSASVTAMPLKSFRGDEGTVPSSPLKDLSGIAVTDAELQIDDSSLKQRGILLITHFGFSGPAALKLSAWGARYLYEKGYTVDLHINWATKHSEENIAQELMRLKSKMSQKNLASESLFELPKNLWKFFTENISKKMSDLSLKEIRSLAAKLHKDTYKVEGKTTN